jgi:hypothetical protein
MKGNLIAMVEFLKFIEASLNQRNMILKGGQDMYYQNVKSFKIFIAETLAMYYLEMGPEILQLLLAVF